MLFSRNKRDRGMMNRTANPFGVAAVRLYQGTSILAHEWPTKGGRVT